MADYLINANSVGGGNSGAARRFARLCLSIDVTCPKFASRTRTSQQYWWSPGRTSIRRQTSIGGTLLLSDSQMLQAVYSALTSSFRTVPFSLLELAGLWNFIQKCGKVLTECVQFRTDCYVSLPFGKEKNKCRNDFSASTHFINARRTK